MIEPRSACGAKSRPEAQLSHVKFSLSRHTEKKKMCPSAAAATNGNGDVPHVPTTNGDVPNDYAAVESHAPSAPEAAQHKSEAANGNGHAASQHNSNPYASRASDFLSNVRFLYR